MGCQKAPASLPWQPLLSFQPPPLGCFTRADGVLPDLQCLDEELVLGLSFRSFFSLPVPNGMRILCQGCRAVGLHLFFPLSPSSGVPLLQHVPV